MAQGAVDQRVGGELARVMAVAQMQIGPCTNVAPACLASKAALSSVILRQIVCAA